MFGPKQSCILKENTPTNGAYGSTPSWATLETFSGVLAHPKARERIIAGQEAAPVEYALYVDRNAITATNQSNLDSEHRIVISSRTYAIKSVSEHFGQGRHWKVLLEDITGREGT